MSESFNSQNPQTRSVNGQIVPHTEESWNAFQASRAPTLSEVKAAIVRLKKEKENGGITYDSVPIATDAEAVGDVLGGLSQTGTILTDSGHRLTINSTVVGAIKDAIEDYRFKVKQRAAVLDEGAESSNDLTAYMDTIQTGWPSTVYTSS